MNITVIGGMNLDFLGVPDSAFLLRDSNPGRVIMRPGGVGRNIAAHLRRLGADVRLITALGSGVHARMLADACRQEGIDLSLSVPTDRPCPVYLCIHDDKGDMAAAVSDMAAVACLTPEAVLSRIAEIDASDACVLDANLPQDTLEAIANTVSVPLIADPVSAAKAQKLLGILPHLTAVKPNRLEASALTGEEEPEKAADTLLKTGVKNVFISLGSEGVYFAGGEDRGFVPAQALPNVPLTGSGDAFCAGLTVALVQRKSPRECARLGCQAACDALTEAREAAGFSCMESRIRL